MTRPLWHPWRLLRHLPALTCDRAPLPAGERGRYYPDHDVILLADHLSQAQRRVTLTHELVHRRRGHTECATPYHEGKQERRCEQETARLLIPLDRLADALAWSVDRHEVAEELWVDVETLDTRLKHLHPAERGYLRRRLSMKEHTA